MKVVKRVAYLKFIEDRIQQMAEDLSDVFGLDITIVDENLLRIAGTGRFLKHMQENSPENSIFDKVLRTSAPAVNVRSSPNSLCHSCPNFQGCEEVGNIAAPILVEGKAIGVISFAAFDRAQNALMEERSDALYKVLVQMADSIAKDVVHIAMLNSINIGEANINELINSIDKGILIIAGDGRVSHINSVALRSLGINITGKSIVGQPVAEVIGGIDFNDSRGRDVYGEWVVEDCLHRVAYRCQEVILGSKKVSTLISFDEQQRVVQLADRLRQEEPSGFTAIIGECEAMKRVVEQAKIAAQTDSSVVIIGESGTGKDLLVKAMHSCSRRRNMPLVSVNCSAIPETLMESELFGYERGAFTGADPKGKPGKFEQANGGVLFLDEIGDLPIHLQPKLLRALQEKEVTRIGSAKPIKLDIKVISATHKDLYAMVRENRFRGDLYYRLNVIPLSLPPLRERGDDIMLCARYFLHKICGKLRAAPKGLSAEARRLFCTYRWPGNLREMENVLEYAANFTPGPEIRVENLPPYLVSSGPPQEQIKLRALESPKLRRSGQTLQEMTEEFEKQVIRQYMALYGDSTEGKKQVARALDVSLTTLYRKL